MEVRGQVEVRRHAEVRRQVKVRERQGQPYTCCHQQPQPLAFQQLEPKCHRFLRELGMEGGREPGRLPERGDCRRAARRMSSSRRAASRSRSRFIFTYSVGSKRLAEPGREEGHEEGRDTSAERDRGGGPAGWGCVGRGIGHHASSSIGTVRHMLGW